MNRIISLYDNAPCFSLIGKSIEEKYEALGIEDKNVLSSHKVDDALIGRIMSSITAEGESFIPRKDIKLIENTFVYRKVLNHTDKYEPYYLALKCINDIGGNNIDHYVPLEEDKRWTEALSYLKGYMELHPQNNTYLNDHRRKELDRAWAAERIAKYGVRVRIENNDLVFDKVNMVTSMISDWVSRIGGIRFVEALLAPMPFDTQKGRLMLLRQGNLPNPNEFVPAYPFGYLLNLGLRHTSSKGSDEALNKYFSQVLDLSRDLCLAVYPYQSYTMWENIFHRSETVLDYFKRLTLQDSIYYLIQSGKAFVQEMCNFLIDEIEKADMKLNADFSLSEYRQLMNGLIDRTDVKKFVRLNPKDIDIFADKGRHLEILKKICFQIGTVNPGYEEPDSYNHVNYSDRPFMMLPNDDIIFYPTTIGVWGWYEMLMSLLRPLDNQIDNKVGLMLEGLMHQKLNDKGIATKTGKYKIDGIDGEADVIMESQNRILLVEMKKKSMTRAARQGYMYQIILDFAGSLLDSQEQCFRTEALLKRKGQIELKVKKKVVDTLEWENRESDKITLTLTDYGTLQSRVVLDKILREMLRYRFCVEEKEIREFEPDGEKQDLIIKGYTKLEKKQNDMSMYLSELQKQEDPKRRYNPFFNSFFFNLEQVIFMVSLANNVDELFDIIDAHRTTMMGTFDFWQEFDFMMKIHQEVKKGY